MNLLPAVHKGKSGGREVSISLLLMWAFESAYLFFWIDHTVISDYREIYSTLTTAVFAFSLGAFGIQKLTDAGAFTPQRRTRETDKMGQV